MQSIAVPVSFTVELQPEGADIGSLERAVSAGLSAAGQQLWAELISMLEGCLRSPGDMSAAAASCGPTAGRPAGW